MCGINGLVNFETQLTQEWLPKMNQVIGHRGPDANGVFHHENVSLGHVRLSILDLSEGANQPMESDDFILVYNGEVYNFEEIKKELNLVCNTTSDTEVILLGFKKIGAAIFEKLNGMFALAIYNKATKVLTLARDRVGIKPLYLYKNEANNSFAFSSEIKGLLINPTIKISLTINVDAVSDFFHLGYIPAPRSIYNEISKFPAGYYAEISNDTITYTKYWQIEDKIKDKVLSDEDEAKTQLDTLLNDAVKVRLKADVPFGTFLSGGIDSSLITALAQKNTEQKLNTFSIGFNEKSHNESHYAAMVADHLGTNHHEFNVSHKEAKNLISTIVDDYDEPYADSSCIPMMLVSKLARSKVTMTLSGDGGDELFQGYGFYNWANRLNNPLIDGLKRPIASALKLGDNRMKRAATMFDYKKGQKQSHIFSQEQYYFSQNEIDELILNKGVILPQLNQDLKSARKLNPAEKQSFFDIKHYLKDELLTKVDIATMKYSLEDRVPLLDHRVVEFALNLDSALKIKNGEQKYILKEVLYQYVPKHIFDRPKQGFSIPLGTWLKEDLKYLIDHYVSDEMIKKVGWLNPATVKQLLKRFHAGEDYLYVRIWAIIIFNQWYEKNVIV